MRRERGKNRKKTREERTEKKERELVTQEDALWSRKASPQQKAFDSRKMQAFQV